MSELISQVSIKLCIKDARRFYYFIPLRVGAYQSLEPYHARIYFHSCKRKILKFNPTLPSRIQTKESQKRSEKSILSQKPCLESDGQYATTQYEQLSILGGLSFQLIYLSSFAKPPMSISSSLCACK